MPINRIRSGAFLALASLGALGALGAAPAASASSEAQLWAYCYFEASGGVGTQLALIVTGPFPILASKKDSLHGGAVAREYDETQGIGKLIPGYRYFMSISGTNCRIRNSRELAQSGVDEKRASVSYGIVRVVPWAPSSEHTGLKADGSVDTGSSKDKPAAAPAPAKAAPPAADLQQLKQQARERVAGLASNPEMVARNKELARRRADARQGRAPTKPAAAKPAVASKPAAAAKPTANAGSLLYWSCHYWNNGAKTSYYSAIGSAPQDKSVSIVQEGLNYRKSWVAHLQQRGLSPGAGGNCTGMHERQRVIDAMASSKSFYIGNHNARTVDTGWVPTVSK